jgi:hypothetical protein
MFDQTIPGMAHQVRHTALYGCGLCQNPAPYMCPACQDVGDDVDVVEPRSINAANSGCAVPADFIYV